MDVKKIKITSEMVNFISEIDEFKGRWSAIEGLPKDRLKALKKIASIESIGSSTRIEGSRLSDEEVEALLKGMDIKSFHSRDEEEVAGYADTMNTVFDNYKNIKISENYIKQLHGILLAYSTKDKRHKGEYKKLPNSVEAFDTNGKSIGIIFQTTSPFETPQKMKELIHWTNNELKAKKFHPLLVIGIFIVTFLAIHPFQDGNGRLSRVLTTLLLLQNNYSYVPYCSLERIVEDNKDAYYISLRSAQKTLWTSMKTIHVWLLFFLTCMKKQKDILSNKIQKEKLLITSSIPELSSTIICLVKDHGTLTISQIEKLTKANRNTIKAHLKKLVEKKQLQKHGKQKGSWYTVGS
ncbi:Fic family protein [Candidatus Margulisiibacteriota bacterium]